MEGDCTSYPPSFSKERDKSGTPKNGKKTFFSHSPTAQYFNCIGYMDVNAKCIWAFVNVVALFVSNVGERKYELRCCVIKLKIYRGLS